MQKGSHMSLEAFSKPGHFYRGNIHTHSTKSDGRLSPEDVCSFYRQRNYDFLMLSDHFLAEYEYPITDTRPFRDENFTTLIGAELHAPATSHGDLWHIVAAGLPFDFTPPHKDEDAYSLAQRAFEAGAFLALAHPGWSGLSVEESRPMDMVHGIEIYNYGCALETDQADGSYLLDALVNEGRRLSCLAVDDAHFKCADYLGAWMMVKAATLDPDDLLAAMIAGEYYSTQGPLLHSLSIEGGEIIIQSSAVYSIAVLGRGCRNRRVSGGNVTSARFPVEVFADDWFRVVLIDENGKRAWSNPVWLGEKS
jgi:histidinol phosphatase-like PHP family hydrolase